MNILGYGVMADWFHAARAIAPDAKLFINEFHIVTSGWNRTATRNLYFDQIQTLQAAGAPIDGLGMQGHFHPDSLTGPEQVWSIMDRFTHLGIPIQITEYDLDTSDRLLQRDYLRDFMTAVFAHESATDFIQWGFWAGAHWRPEAALFDLDWTIRPHGEEYIRLVFDEWWTDELLSSDPNGLATLRAFLGDYEITVTSGDMILLYNLHLADNGQTYELVAVVPEPGTAGIVLSLTFLLARRMRRTGSEN